MSELCHAYNISRKTGYKWLGRYRQGGLEALRDRSSAPRHHPHEISGFIKDQILSIKARFPHWGARKVRARFERLHPTWERYPAISTIGLFLHKQGLTHSRKKRSRCSPTEWPLTEGRYSNHVWCADFKGHFKTRDGRRCNPLTISDHFSRYLLCCRHLDRAFREYGLPEVIRTDNGAPFASIGLCGLSRLSYWWIRLGIYPERIEPGHPGQNGRHERLHKTLKAYTSKPPAATLKHQQKRFDGFRVEYNEQRPHEALQMKTPSAFYSHSVRPYPVRLPAICYPDHMRVSRVQMHGDILYQCKRIFITESLYGEYIGIEQVAQDRSLIWYCKYLLGQIDHQVWKVRPAKSASLLSAASCGKKST